MTRLIAPLFLMLVTLFAAGCTPIVRVRTLPSSIRSVHVPMVVNRSAEPGLEERLTVALQEELLADGRLNVVQRNRADAIIEVTIRDFSRLSAGFDNDDFATDRTFAVDSELSIIENVPGQPLIGEKRRLITRVGYGADPRRTQYEPEDERKVNLYRELARQIVMEVLTGEFTEVVLESDQIPISSEVDRPAAF